MRLKSVVAVKSEVRDVEQRLEEHGAGPAKIARSAAIPLCNVHNDLGRCCRQLLPPWRRRGA